MTTTLRIDAKLAWFFREDPASKQYVAVCPPLRLTAAGETMNDLCRDMSGAIQDLFVDLLASNDLDTFLNTHGWKRGQLVPGVHPDKVRFDVPFELIHQQMEHKRAHA